MHPDVEAAEAASRSDRRPASRVYEEGIVAGILGAATVAIWFLIVDSLNGRPLYTPSLLGTALFGRGRGLPSPESPAVSFEMVAMFTWVHGLVFVIIGAVVSRLLALAERQPGLGFGILLLFVVLESGFVAAAMILAEPLLHALAWPAVLVANTLAATAMGAYFWRHRPNLRINP